MAAGIVLVYFMGGGRGDKAASGTTVTAPTVHAQPARSDPRAGMSAMNATNVDFRELDADPALFKGQNIAFQGTVLNVAQEDGYTWVQVLANVPTISATASIVVELVPKDNSVLKGECFRFYGAGAGTTQVKLLMTGAINDKALIAGYRAEKRPSSIGGFCSTSS